MINRFLGWLYRQNDRTWQRTVVVLAVLLLLTIAAVIHHLFF